MIYFLVVFYFSGLVYHYTILNDHNTIRFSSERYVLALVFWPMITVSLFIGLLKCVNNFLRT